MGFFDPFVARAHPADALAQTRRALDITGPLGDADLRAKLTAQIIAIESATAEQ